MNELSAPVTLVASPSFSGSSVLMSELEEVVGSGIHANNEGNRYSEAELIEKIQRSNALIAVVGLETISERVLKSCPSLKFVAKYGVGLDNINQSALKNAGVGLGWTPGVNKRSVSELSMSFMLGHFRNIFNSVYLMKSGSWVKNGGFSLQGKTLGLVGFGHIGQDLASIARHFGMKIIYFDILDKSLEAAAIGAEYRAYDSLLEEADIISYHVPSTDLTHHMLNGSNLSLCKSHALVINTARGDVIDFTQAYEYLKRGRIGGLAIDVFEVEPYLDGLSLEHDNLYMTPHIGGNAKESVEAMGRSAISHIASYLSC